MRDELSDVRGSKCERARRETGTRDRERERSDVSSASIEWTILDDFCKRGSRERGSARVKKEDLSE